MGENENFSDAVKEGMKNAQEIQNNAGSSYQGLDAAEGATSELVTPSQQPQNAGSRPNPFDNMQNVGAGQNPFNNMQAQNPYMNGQPNPYMGGANPYMNGQPNPFDNMQKAAGPVNPFDNMQGDNPYFQGTPETPDGGKSAKKKMSKGKKIGIISGIVAFVAALAICGFIFIPKLLKPKKETIKSAVQKTQQNFAQANMFTTEFGAADFGNSFMNGGGRIVFKAKNPKDTNEFVDIDANIDIANKEGSFVVTGNTADGLDGTARGYFNSEKAYMTVDDEMSGYYYIDFATAASEYLNSYISSIASLFRYSYGSSSLTSLASGAAVSPEQLQQLRDIFKGLIDKIEYSNGGSKKLTLGGKSYDTTKYVLTIPKKELQNTVSDALDAVLSTGAIGGSNGEYYAAMISSYISTIFNKDVKINLYVYNDAVIAVDAGYDIDILGQKASASFNAQFEGKDDLYSAFYASFKLEAADISMEWVLSYDSYDIQDGTECVISFKTINDGDVDNQNDIVISYNRVTSDIAFSMQYPDFDEELVYYGKVVALEKGKKLEIQFDTVAEKSIGSDVEDTIPVDAFVGIYTDYTVEKAPTDVKLVNFLTSSETEFKSILSQKLIDYIDKMSEPITIYDYDKWEEETTTEATTEATTTTATETTTEASTEAATEK